MHEQKGSGVRYMVYAAFFFSIMSLLVKIAGQRLPTSELVLARSVIGLILTFVLLRRHKISPWGHQRRLLLARGFFGFLGLLCLFYAFTHLPLADATVLQYTNPLFTALLAGIFLNEAMRRKEWLGLVLSVLGILFVAKPSFFLFAPVASLDPFAVLMALLGALFAAVAYTLVRKLRETEHHLVVVLYFPLVATPASLPLVIAEGMWPTPTEWLLLLAIGITTQFGQVYLTKGLHRERAGRAMSISYLQIVFAAFWGVVFFAETPDLLGVVGTLLILGGTAVLSLKNIRPSSVR